ncbi:MAG: M14 family metallopeptidase [Gemmatimonadota bacterium]|jgi:hypothetical protein
MRLVPTSVSSVPSFLVTLGSLTAAVGGAAPAWAQSSGTLEGLRTRAEATGYVETSRYEDVVGFLEAVDAASDRAWLTNMGYTTEGRAIPLLVVGDVEDPSPASVRASGKLRIYVQGNIHAGEVPGKEALQMLARELAAGDHGPWLDEVVLLLAPIYNVDGNERVRLDNRPRQHGPLGGMGQRPNAAGLDLNRDHMKLDAPESRSFVRLMTDYDPHLAVDLHTTNGTRHAYHITYAPPLHPGTHEAVTGLLRDEMLPALTERIHRDHGMRFYYYGNVYEGPEGRGWYTFDHRPRFNNNYVGLRNRLAILSEAYAYLTFEERVRATKVFVEEIVEYAAAHAGDLAAAVEAADAADVVGVELPTRATLARSDTMVTILMGGVERERHPWTGEPILRRLPVERPEAMWEFGTFRAAETERAPATYLVPGDLEIVLDRLSAHGVRIERLREEELRGVEVFALDSVATAPREFQGHRERTLFGRWVSVERTVPAGTALVRVDQPLGRLAFYLLEPRSDDGLAAWGILDDALEGVEEYPVLRVPAPGP